MAHTTIGIALESALNQTEQNESVEVLINRFRERVQPNDKRLSKLIEYSLSDNVLIRLNSLRGKSDFFDHSNDIISLVNLLLTEQKLDKQAIINDVLPIYLDVLDLNYDVGIKTDFQEPKQKMYKSKLKRKEKINDFSKEKDTIKRSPEKDLQQSERVFHVAPLSWLFFLSYIIVMLSWITSFIYLFFKDTEDWWVSLLPCSMSILLTLAATQIIPLIKSSYDNSMLFYRYTYFLEIRNNESDEVKTAPLNALNKGI